MTRSSLASRRRAFVGVLHLVAALALAITGCGGGVSPEQKAALAKIQSLGGKVNYEEGGYTIDLNGTAVEDADLGVLKDIANVKRVYLKGTVITDAGLEHLQKLSGLDRIIIERTLVTPDGLATLKKALPKTEVLH